MVLSAVVDDILTTSSHLECASRTIRNISFMKGPVKSTWIRFHGPWGQIQGSA